MRAISLHLVLAALIANGCSNFQDESTIVDLRILGIKADPSEIYVDPTTVDPTDDNKTFTSTLTALVLDPAGQGRAVSYSAFACPRAIDTITAATGRNGVVCAHDDPTTVDLLDPPGPHDTAESGAEHDIVVPFAVSPRQLAGAYLLDTQAMVAAFQLPIVVQLELSAGMEKLVATKRVIFSQQLPDRPPQDANQNPVITTITTYPSRDDKANPVGPNDLPEGAMLTLPLGGAIWLEPGGAIAERYAIREATHDVHPQIVVKDVPAEALRYAYFATAGTFSPVETSTIPLSIFDKPDHVHIESQYVAPTTMPADGNVTVWIVVRDERGGASWTTRQITLAPP